MPKRAAKKHADASLPSLLNRETALFAACVSLLAILAFLPAVGNEFVGDDLGNFVVNTDFVGLGAKGIGWAFTTKTVGVYQPLSWLVLEAQRSVFDLNPHGYHVVSLFFHAMNCALLYFLVLTLLQLSGSEKLQSGRWRNLTAAFAVALFAVHPLRTEVVAWVSCQPYLVCGFFLLLSALSYLRYGVEKAKSRRWLAASLAFFFAALLSKAVALMFPALLILLDIYPLRRTGRAWKEKIPFIALTLVFAKISFWARIGYGGAGIEYGLVAKIAIACHCISFFLWKSLSPTGLAGFYPMPSEGELLSNVLAFVPVAVVSLLSLLAIYYRHRFTAAALVWAGYIAFLFPNLGLFSFSNSVTADRYSYAGTMGWVVLTAAALCFRLPELWQKRVQRLFPSAGLCLLAALFFLSWRQVKTWRNNETFWTHVYHHGGENSDLANYHLGVALANAGKVEESVAYIDRSLELCADEETKVRRLADLALDLRKKGEYMAGLHWLEIALRLKPSDAVAHNDTGAILFQLHYLDAALAQFQLALQLKPDLKEAATNVEVALHEQAETDQKIPILREELRKHPDDLATLNRLGVSLAMRGKFDEALELFDKALAINPSFEVTHANIAETQKLKKGPPIALDRVPAGH